MRAAATFAVLAIALVLGAEAQGNGANNGGFNFGSNNGGGNGNQNNVGAGNGAANGNRNAGNGNGNINGNGNAGNNNGVFNGNFNAGNRNGGNSGNNNLGSGNGGNNGNSNTGNGNGVFNGNSNTGNNNGNQNGNFNFGNGNGANNGNGNIGNNNGNGNGNNNGGGVGDPIFTDFVGRSFEFLGEPGKFYSILSEKFHSLSTLLKFGQMWDHNGTYMEGYGFQYRGNTVVVAIDAEDKLTVSLNGDRLVLGEDETEMEHVLEAGAGRSLTLDYQLHRPGLGQAVELTTEMIKLTLWLTEAGTRDAGGVLQPAYLNFDLALLSSPASEEMAGIVGETYERLLAGAEAVGAATHALHLPDDRMFRGHALSEDYEQQGYFDAAHRFNLYGGPTVRARRLAETSSGIAFPALAAGRNVPAAKGASARTKAVARRSLRTL